MKHSHIADGNIFNGEQLAIHVRTLNHLLFDPEIPILEFNLQIYPQRCVMPLYKIIHCSIAYNSKRLEIVLIPINKGSVES